MNKDTKEAAGQGKSLLGRGSSKSQEPGKAWKNQGTWGSEA